MFSDQSPLRSARAPGSEERSYTLGLKIDTAADAVWAATNTNTGASVRCYDLETGKIRQTVSIDGKHVFNDLTISSTGTVYVSDTAEGSVYGVTPGTAAPRRIAPQHAFTAANGIALSADGRLLYVSTWQDGIDVIDLPSATVMPLIHPANVSLAFIDGLYVTQRSLLAIQNGPMLPRIVAFELHENQRQIVAMRVLERRNPAFDGITTGAVVHSNLYYIANPQTDRNGDAELHPLRLFSIRIDP